MKTLKDFLNDDPTLTMQVIPVSVLEQIRQEIEQERRSCKELHDWYGIKVIDEILKIFDKHLKEG